MPSETEQALARVEAYASGTLLHEAYDGDPLQRLDGFKADLTILLSLARQASGSSSLNAAPHPDPVPPVVDWQDISTAPRDEVILLYGLLDPRSRKEKS